MAANAMTTETSSKPSVKQRKYSVDKIKAKSHSTTNIELNSKTHAEANSYLYRYSKSLGSG